MIKFGRNHYLYTIHSEWPRRQLVVAVYAEGWGVNSQERLHRFALCKWRSGGGGGGTAL